MTPAPDKPPCTRCGRPNYMGQPLHRMGRRVRVCIDCFCFLSGIDPRDPVTDATARSGTPDYIPRDLLGKDRPAGAAALTKAADPRLTAGKSNGHHNLARDPDLPPAGYERPPLAPLPKTSPWWARALHWVAIRVVSER